MEQCSPFGWIYCNEDEGMMMSDMRHYIVQSRMELEATIFAAQEEMMRKEEELLHMKDLLMSTINERDEAQCKLHNVMLEKLLLQQQLLEQQKQPQIPKKLTNCLSSSSSESEDSSIITSSPRTTTTGLVLQPQPQQLPTLPPQIVEKLATSCRPLPEKGKLLKAVMEAGPLLQTLLLAGPLPQWQHPPPQLDSIEIPPITINTTSIINSPRKRGLDNFDCSMISSPKYQRVV
ncbi:uncharacterized protein LOC141612112 [Silene latifolia]|uniref:uncharacterized protein LOC141612112 n=1 Tax=Silene latifolia TaxID=37657 RepID=UPI003D772CDC